MSNKKELDVPKIPGYVANWVDLKKKEEMNPFNALAYLAKSNHCSPGEDKVRKYLGHNGWTEKFNHDQEVENVTLAIMFDYEVEEEKYHALIKGGLYLESQHEVPNTRYYMMGDDRVNVSSTNIKLSSRVAPLSEWNRKGLNMSNADFYSESAMKMERQKD